jgi:hypothetical protein
LLLTHYPRMVLYAAGNRLPAPEHTRNEQRLQ